jgi:L-ascorbate metabolism protein UlaG (beta-lactamase superfamily)
MLRREDHSGAAITWLGHATVLIEVGGLRILTDPVLGRRTFLLRRLVAAPKRELVQDVDVVLVSHAHADHLDLSSVRSVRPAGPIFAPAAAVRYLRRHAVAGVQEAIAGSSVEHRGVTVQTVHADHDGRRWPRGRDTAAVGYVVRGGASVYFAGDTDLCPEMSALSGHVDIALIPVAGWGPTVPEGHLNPERAARAVATIAPRVAIPIHWGTLGLPWTRPSDDERHAPVRAFAEAAARHAPDVEVRVLEPSERTTVHPEPALPAAGR